MNFVKTTIAHPFLVAGLLGLIVATALIELFRKQSSNSLAKS
jgi:hypothetical protein